MILGILSTDIANQFLNHLGRRREEFRVRKYIFFVLYKKFFLHLPTGLSIQEATDACKVLILLTFF